MDKRICMILCAFESLFPICLLIGKIYRLHLWGNSQWMQLNPLHSPLQHSAPPPPCHLASQALVRKCRLWGRMVGSCLLSTTMRNITVMCNTFFCDEFNSLILDEIDWFWMLHSVEYLALLKTCQGIRSCLFGPNPSIMDMSDMIQFWRLAQATSLSCHYKNFSFAADISSGFWICIWISFLSAPPAN